MKNKFLLIIILLVAGLFFGQAHFTKAAIDGGDADYLLYNYGYNNWEDLSYNQRTVVKKVYIQGINNGMTHQQALNESRAVWAGVRDGFNRSEPFNSTILSNIPGVSWNVQKTENGNISVDQNMTNSYHPIVPEENRNFQAILNNRQTNDNDSMNNGSLDQMDNSLQADNSTLIGTNSSNQQNVNNHQATSSQATGSNTQTNCGKEGLQGVDFLVFHGPLVPCGIDKQCAGGGGGGNDETNSVHVTCTLCHFIILIKNIFDLLLSLIITVSLLMLTIAGVLYIISSGGAMTSLAKGIIEKTLLGFGIFLLSWLIVYTILNLLSVKENGMIGKGTADSWFQFTCDTESSFDKGLLEGGNTGTGGQQGGNTGGTGGQQGGNTGAGGQQGGNTGTQPGTNNGGNPNVEAPATSTPEGQARASLFEDSGGNISVWESRTGATNVRDLRPTTRRGVIDFQREVGNPIIITGGAESGYHANDGAGGYTHQNGYKVDIEDTPTVNNYIENHYDYVGYRSGTHGGRVYADRHGNYYTREDTHWDVCYNCPSPTISTLH